MSTSFFKIIYISSPRIIFIAWTLLLTPSFLYKFEACTLTVFVDTNNMSAISLLFLPSVTPGIKIKQKYLVLLPKNNKGRIYDLTKEFEGECYEA